MSAASSPAPATQKSGPTTGDAVATTLLLSCMTDRQPEIFSSIQGEGASAGVASTFVRLATCNLRCTWCDTAYTWDWSRFDRAEQTIEMRVEAIAQDVVARAPRNVVITGGEPLIQRRQLLPLVALLKDAGMRIEIETNGTIAPGELSDSIDQWNVSPKLRHAGNEGLDRLPESALRDFAGRANAFFKFVVQQESDLAEVEAIREEYGIPRERIVLMPEGTTAAQLNARSPWLAEICAERGYRFSSRLHILIWGDKRGV